MDSNKTFYPTNQLAFNVFCFAVVCARNFELNFFIEVKCEDPDLKDLYESSLGFIFIVIMINIGFLSLISDKKATFIPKIRAGSGSSPDESYFCETEDQNSVKKMNRL
jgi:hypothetical protein